MCFLSYEVGIEIYRIEGVDVLIYSVVKMIVDCFKFWNKIGFDVVFEVLCEVL